MKPMLFPLKSSATISTCGRYRRTLVRIWESTKPLVLWICLNPSTADAERTDPSLSKMCGFSRRWGFGGLVLENAFDLRATDPRVMLAHAAPVSLGNDAAIVASADKCLRIVIAWGNDGSHHGRDREVLALLPGLEVKCLGVNKTGQPKHPLFVAGSTELRAFEK